MSGRCTTVRSRLAPGAVHVWYAFTDAVGAELLGTCAAILSEDERERMARFVFARDQHTYLVSHALVRFCLSWYADVPPQAWAFDTSSHGRPFISSPDEHTWLDFNLSHTTGLVAVAITADCQVGVDVERSTRREGELEIARHFFAPQECLVLEQEPPERREAAFSEFWTLKESYVKARGLGLSIPLNQFWFERNPLGGPMARFAPELHDDPDRWTFASLRPTKDYVMAVAISSKSGRETALTVREAPLR